MLDISIKWAVAIVLAGTLVVWIAAQIAARNAPPSIESSAPDFTLESTDGETISLKALGRRPTVVVFVASWCQVCREEMPTMAETYLAHAEHGLVFLGVDVYEDYLVAQQFRQEFQMPFPLWWMRMAR